MRSMQCNVDCGYRLSICCRAEENHGIPSSIWPVAEHGVTHLLVSSGGFKKKNMGRTGSPDVYSCHKFRIVLHNVYV